MLQLKEYFEKIAPRWRTREARKNRALLVELNALYPQVALNLQIDALVSGRTPYCVVCNSPVKTLGKTTCSIKCRDNLASQAENVTKKIEKFRRTCIEKYGVDNPNKNIKVQARRLQTMHQKYGAAVSPKTAAAARARAPQLQEQSRETLLEKYGVINCSQLESVKEKKKQNNIEKYGVENVSQRHINPTHLAILNDRNALEKFISDKNIKEAAQELGIDATTLYGKVKIYGIGNIRKVSSYESEIAAWLEPLGVEFVRNTKKVITPQELDFYFPKHNLAIEFNGLAHHSEYLGAALRKNSTNFKTYHYEKWKKCADLGINLISIFEDEWNEKKEVIKRRIVRELGVDSIPSLGARKTVVEKIHDKKKSLEFLDQYHWQGSIKNFQLGYQAHYQGQLVGVMTFSSKTDSEYELTRYCVANSCPGLFAKMLTAFVREYKPNKIITFSDNRYATGGIYARNGFVNIKELGPGYSITNYQQRWHRSNFQRKHIAKKFGIDIDGKSEIELIRNHLKFDRVWDCGKKKWEWSA
jgi:hypothetical protein